MFDRQLFMDKCVEITKTTERDTLVKSAAKHASGFGWETMCYGHNPESTMETLTRSIAEMYISLMCVNMLFHVNPHEVGRQVSGQLTGNAEVEVERDTFLEKCQEISDKSKENQMNLGDFVTERAVTYAFQITAYGRDTSCTNETLAASIADMYISLMSSMKYFDVDSDEVDRFIAEQMGIKRWEDMNAEELEAALDRAHDSMGEEALAAMLGIEFDNDEDDRQAE